MRNVKKNYKTIAFALTFISLSSYGQSYDLLNPTYEGTSGLTWFDSLSDKADFFNQMITEAKGALANAPGNKISLKDDVAIALIRIDNDATYSGTDDVNKYLFLFNSNGSSTTTKTYSTSNTINSDLSYVSYNFYAGINITRFDIKINIFDGVYDDDDEFDLIFNYDVPLTAYQDNIDGTLIKRIWNESPDFPHVLSSVQITGKN